MRCSIAVLLAACAPSGPQLPPYDELWRFEDRSGERCAPEVVAAYGGPSTGASVATLSGEDDRLFVLLEQDDEIWVTTLDVARPTDALAVGTVALPGLDWPTLARVDGDRLLLASARPAAVALVDVAVPHEAEVLDVLRLASEPRAFAPRGDLVFTDATDAHALDRTDPRALEAVVFGDQPPYGAPLVLGDELLTATWDGLPGEECAVAVHDATTVPPAEQARVATEACLDAALVETPAGGIGAGWRDGVASAAALVRDDARWSASGAVELGGSFDRYLGAVAVDEGALVVGGHDAANRGEWLVVRDGAAEIAATWSPTPGYLEGVAAAGGLAWIGVSRESGEFEGVVGLDFGRCR